MKKLIAVSVLGVILICSIVISLAANSYAASISEREMREKAPSNTAPAPGKVTTKPVSPPPVPTPLPDLTINNLIIWATDSASHTPVDPVCLGQKSTADCIFSNVNGQLLVSYSNPIKIGHYLDGQLKKTDDFRTALDTGATAGAYFTFIPDSVGRHTYKCVLDYTGVVTESNESNNQKEISFDVKNCTYDLGANLKVTDLIIDDITGKITAKAENTGSPTTEDAKLILRVRSTPVKECVWPKGAQKAECTYVFDMSCGIEGIPVSAGWVYGGRKSYADGYTSDPDTQKVKNGEFHGHSDLKIRGFTRLEKNQLTAVVRNDGLCIQPWRYRVTLLSERWGEIDSYEGQGPLLKRYETEMIRLPESFFPWSQFDPRTGSVKVEVLPQNPRSDQHLNDNSLTVKVADIRCSVDFEVTDIKLDKDFKIHPIIQNLGHLMSKSCTYDALGIEPIIDGVSKGILCTNMWGINYIRNVDHLQVPGKLFWDACPMPVLHGGTHVVEIRLHSKHLTSNGYFKKTIDLNLTGGGL